MTTSEQIRKVCNYASGDYDNRLLIAMVKTLPFQKVWETSRNVDGISTVRNIVHYLERHDGDYDKPVPAPLYRPVSRVLSDFNKGKKKAQCRKELQDRLLYMTAIDKKRVIYTFLNGCKIDRIWTFKHLFKHWDDRFLKAVEVLFEMFREPEAAKIICRYDTVEYIRKHLKELSTSYLYVETRRHLSADEPIDRSLCKGNWEYLMLLAYLGLPISKEDAMKELGDQLRQEITMAYHYDIFPSVLYLPHVRQMVWALGRLKRLDVLFELQAFEQNTLPLFKAREYSKTLELLWE